MEIPILLRMYLSIITPIMQIGGTSFPLFYRGKEHYSFLFHLFTCFLLYEFEVPHFVKRRAVRVNVFIVALNALYVVSIQVRTLIYGKLYGKF